MIVNKKDLGKAIVTVANNEVWNKDDAYEKLTFVKFEGKIYLSKKDVPAGISPTGEINDEYWLDFAISSSSVTIGRGYTRSIDEPTIPTGGNYTEPYPVEEQWHEEPIAGDDPLWYSERLFTSDGANQDDAWSAPIRITDSRYIEIKYSEVADNPGTPDTNPENWSDTSTNFVHIAIREVLNGLKNPWNIATLSSSGGGGGNSNVIVIPSAVAVLTATATSDQIFAAFGGKTEYNRIIQKIDNTSVLMYYHDDNPKENSVIQFVSYSYTDDDNSELILVDSDGEFRELMFMNADGVISCQVNNIKCIGEAPTDGKDYVRNNGAWKTITAGKEEVYIFNPTVSDDSKITQADYDNLKAAILANKVIIIGGVSTVIQVNAAYDSDNGTITLTAGGIAIFGYIISAQLTMTAETHYVMTLDNTAPYTPTADYHPAHKKYVDNAVNDAKFNGLIILPANIVSLNDESTSAQVFEALGGKDAWTEIAKNFNDNTIFKLYDGAIFYSSIASLSYYTDADNNGFTAQFFVNSNVATMTVTVTEGVAKFTTNRVGQFVTSNNLTEITKMSNEDYNALTNKSATTAYFLTNS